jgi:nucleoside-diphosphate-sugar epimerase
VAALDRGRLGQAYSLGGQCLTVGEAFNIAARIGGHRSPRITLPTALLRLIASINDPLGGLPGSPANLREIIRSGDGVTYWVSHDKASKELGFEPRSLEQGMADTWRRGSN